MIKFSEVLGDIPEREITLEFGKLIYRFAPGKTLEIVDIGVGVEHRRQGIGVELLRKLILANSSSQVIYAFTAEDNFLAQGWYKKNGFALTFIKDFYKSKGAYLCVRVL
jgi:ribosomal protein S18 acetylase RimI-like enzyme